MPTEEQQVSVKLSLLELRGHREFQLCIKHKEDVTGWRILSAIVMLLTFGMVNLLEKFWVTFGNVVYVPRRVDQKGKVYRYGDLPYEDYVVLSHELKHVEQYARLGFTSFKGGRALGVVVFELLYIFLFFPIGLAYGRYRLEREAYLAGIIAARRIGYDEWASRHYSKPPQPQLEKAIRACSTSPWYLWPWPFPKSVRQWFEAALLREEARSRSVLRSSQAD